MTDEAMSPLRRRMIEDMTIRKFAPKTQHDFGRKRTCRWARPRRCGLRAEKSSPRRGIRTARKARIRRDRLGEGERDFTPRAHVVLPSSLRRVLLSWGQAGPQASLRRLHSRPPPSRHPPRLGAQQPQEPQVHLRRVPVDPARHAVAAAQVRRAERQDGERGALARLRRRTPRELDVRSAPGSGRRVDIAAGPRRAIQRTVWP